MRLARGTVAASTKTRRCSQHCEEQVLHLGNSVVCHSCATALHYCIPFQGPGSPPAPPFQKMGLWPSPDFGKRSSFHRETFVLQAKASLGEYQPRHAAAKAVLQERKKLTDGLARPALPVPPRGTPREAQQLAAWKQLLAFERYTALTVVLCCSVDQGQDKRGIASCLHCTCCSSTFP
jgi:hypothetical protein